MQGVEYRIWKNGPGNLPSFVDFVITKILPLNPYRNVALNRPAPDARELLLLYPYYFMHRKCFAYKYSSYTSKDEDVSTMAWYSHAL